MPSLARSRTPRRARGFALVVVAAATGAGSVAAGAGASASAATASSVLLAAKAAIAKQVSVHLVITSKSGSRSSVESVIADLGKKSGREVISQGKATVTVEVTPASGYMGGNSSGLTTIFGLSATDAKKLGGRWASFKPSTSQYPNLRSATTIGAVTGVLPPAKGTRLSIESVKGTKTTKATRLYLLAWTTAATSSSPKLANKLTVDAVGAALPVEETTTASSGSEVAKFSKWGERVVVRAPRAGSAIAYSKIIG